MAKEAPKTAIKAPSESIKMFSLIRKNGGWSFVEAVVQLEGDGKAGTTDVSIHEPDLKMITIERFKIAAWKWWTSL